MENKRQFSYDEYDYTSRGKEFKMTPEDSKHYPHKQWDHPHLNPSESNPSIHKKKPRLKPDPSTVEAELQREEDLWNS